MIRSIGVANDDEVTPDPIAAEQRDIGHIADAIRRIAEYTPLEDWLGISGAIGVFEKGKVLVSYPGITAAGPATTRNCAQEARAGGAIAEASSSGWRTEPFDVVNQVA